MKNLLTKTLKPFTLYALVVLKASIPAYYYLVNSIWLEELDEHNTIQADRTQHELNQISLTETELAESITLWNKIQPGTNLEKFSQRVFSGDSTYTVIKQHPAVQNNERKRFRGLARIIYINGKPYRLLVETNVEESEEIVIAIAILTFIFFLILVIGFLLINRRLSIQLWKPFRSTLATLKTFNLYSQTQLTFDPSDTLEFEELNEALGKLINHTVSVYKSQKEFTENASHELQTPLAILKNKLDLLLQKEPVTSRQYQLVEDMNRTLTRISRINKNLLLLAKIDNHQFDTTESIDSSLLLRQCLETLTEHIAAKQIRLQTEIMGDVWIEGNKTLLEILMNNLLVNAIRHNDYNGELLVCFDKKTLTIANSGTAALRSETTFNRFSKNASDTSGSGLGLAIVKQICHRHKWTVQYQFERKYHLFTVHF